MGVHEYFTLLKITNAKSLLKSGESVTKTAEICGFANQAYFSAAFKRVTGLSPKEYAPQREKTPRQAPRTATKKQEKSLRILTLIRKKGKRRGSFVFNRLSSVAPQSAGL